MTMDLQGEASPEGLTQFHATQRLEGSMATAGIGAGSTDDEEGRVIEAILPGCLRKIRRWRVPPRWSVPDWSAEIAAELTFAALQAARDFDPARGVPREVFLRQRVMHRAYSHYRREWTYAMRHVARAELGCEGQSDVGDRPSARTRTEFFREVEMLLEALRRLSHSDFWLIDELYWGGKTEFELAKVLGVSQQAVSKRKRTVFKTLHHLILEIANHSDL
jgi:DNA-directed RNA polymerase specialized sigma24 family protein